MYTAAALLYPDALATSITLPMEILQAASQMASLRSAGKPQVRFLLAAPHGGNLPWQRHHPQARPRHRRTAAPRPAVAAGHLAQPVAHRHAARDWLPC